MRRLTALALVVPLALAAGCGDDEPLDRLDGYVREANAVQAASAPRFVQANERYRAFAKGELKGSRAERELLRSELDVEEARRTLTRLRPPVEAVALHRKLLRVYELTVLMAAETRGLAAYTPRADRAIARLQRARRTLRRDLREARGEERQVAALRAYARAIQRARTTLRSLRPPPAVVAGHETRLRVLGRARRLSLELVGAIRRRDTARVGELVLRFDSGADPQPELARTGKGALRAYRDRLAQLDRAAVEARRERARVIARLR